MKIIAGVMAWNAAEYLDYCLTGLHGNVDGIIVAEGAVGRTIAAGFEPRSTDDTCKILKRWTRKGVENFPVNKATIQTQWQWILEEVRVRHEPCWLLAVDDDEIYTGEIIAEFRAWLEREEPKGLLGGKIHGMYFVNDFWTYLDTPLASFVKVTSGTFASGPRTFHIGAYDTSHPNGREMQYAPVRHFHYSMVKSAEHWQRWLKWCPHKKTVYKRVIRGAFVGEAGRKLETFLGEHPPFMRKHPYYRNPPAYQNLP